jgi:hypothetical protein
VGAIVWSGENNVITVWGNNEINDVIDGIQSGEEIGFRVWRKSTGTVYTYVQKEYSKGNGLYAVNGLYVLSLLDAVSAPSAPTLSSPSNNATDINVPVTLQWNASNRAESYTVQVSKNPNMSSPVISQSGITGTSYEVSGLDYVTQYYWRVRAVNPAGNSSWSTTYNFTTEVLIVTSGLQLHSGWNMISSRVKPTQTDIQSLFSEIVSDVLLVKNGDGETYWPAMAVDQIVNWNYKSGYQVYMHADRVLNFVGTPVVTSEETIQLPAGWSTVAYLSESSLDPAIALENLGGNLVIVKNNTGGVYWPEFGSNTMGTMNPGEGYQLYLQNSAALVYPGTGTINKASEAVTMFTDHPERFTFSYDPTGLNATIMLIASSPADGDEVGVFTAAGEVVGSGVFHSGKALLTVWGRDEVNPVGAISGESLSFTYYSAADQKEDQLIIELVTDVLTGETVKGGFFYAHNGVFVVNGSVSMSSDIGEQVPTEYMLAQNYPNPFNPSTTITFSIPDGGYTTLKVYNTLGVEIATLVDDQLAAGYYTQRWEASGVASGLYFYQLRSGSYVETRRMLLMK